MVAGILISGVVAGVLSLLTALVLDAGLTLGAIGYVGGGMCGCALFLRVALRRAGAEIG